MNQYAIGFLDRINGKELTVELVEAEDILAALQKDIRTKDYFGDMSAIQLNAIRGDDDAIKDLFLSQDAEVGWIEL